MLKTQLSRNKQAAGEESGSSEGGKWDHTLEKPLKKLLHSPAACKTWVLLCCKDLFAMVQREALEKFKSGSGADPTLHCQVWAALSPCSIFLFKTGTAGT